MELGRSAESGSAGESSTRRMAVGRAGDEAVGMTSRNGKHGEADALLTTQAAARRFAGAIVAAFGVCDEVCTPLTDLQKITVIQAALLEFDGLEAELASLSRIGDSAPRAPVERGGDLIPCDGQDGRIGPSGHLLACRPLLTP